MFLLFFLQFREALKFRTYTFPPSSLGNLIMSSLNHSGEEAVECPLCMEPLEMDDLSFFPCTCGYQASNPIHIIYLTLNSFFHFLYIPINNLFLLLCIDMSLLLA